MEFIAHRINTIKELKQVPKEFGVEVDLRDYGKRLVLQHDPFKSGEDFADYLKHYRHGTLILNIKSERIEYKVLELMKRYKIKEYFFLDNSFPMINALIKARENKIAVRFSEFESLDTILTLERKVRWVWVDCFTKLPINKKNFTQLKKAGFKLCLVSPELQGRPKDIRKYRNFLDKERIFFDAICTKLWNIPEWRLRPKGVPCLP